MSDVDFEYADLLLHIVEGVSKVAPAMTHLSSAAMEELGRMNSAIGDERKAEAKRLVEEAAVAKATQLKAADVPTDEADPNETTEPETDETPRRI